MKPLTREWVGKAEADLRTAGREWRVRRQPNYDAVCFHAQQAAEKHLKARLQEADLAFEKTHNLIRLLDLALAVEPGWEAFRAQLLVLNQFAVAFRYPGETAQKQTAAQALKISRALRREARSALQTESLSWSIRRVAARTGRTACR
jgi:HEPN domain-containing protein